MEIFTELIFKNTYRNVHHSVTAFCKILYYSVPLESYMFLNFSRLILQLSTIEG